MNVPHRDWSAGVLTGDDVKRCREHFSKLLGWRVSQHDLGVALKLAPASAKDTIRQFEDGSRVVTGPASVALELLYRMTTDALPRLQAVFLVDEDACPGHVASARDPKVCGRCGVHIDSFRPPDDDGVDHDPT